MNTSESAPSQRNHEDSKTEQVVNAAAMHDDTEEMASAASVTSSIKEHVGPHSPATDDSALLEYYFENMQYISD